MTIDTNIINEKLQFDINKAATKIFALSSGKIDKYEYLTDVKILSLQQYRIIEYANFTYVLRSKKKNKQEPLKRKEKNN